MELKVAEEIAKQVVDKLSPFCQRIEVAGSIRRQRPLPKDIDIVLIPKDAWNLRAEVLNLCWPFFPQGGDKLVRFGVNGVQVDLYFADETTWATLLLIRTGSTEHNIKLCSLAKKKGWHLHANGQGLFNEKGQRIAGETEESIFEALGLEYIAPEKREARC